jgi:RES domain-containing protein
MDLFRITKAPYADLSGKGGLSYPGRWHSRGRPIVYTAASRALSMLEVLVHTDPEGVPDDLVLLTIDVPDNLAIREITLEALPEDWTEPLHPQTMAIGDRWLRAQDTPVLRVPSVLVPEESNLLINPLHPDAAAIEIRAQRDFAFDERLLDAAQR